MARHKENTEINLIGDREQQLRLDRLKGLMRAAGIENALVRDNSNIYYLTGRVFRGFIYINTGLERPRYFVRKPNELTSSIEGLVHRIRKPEEIAGMLEAEGLAVTSPVALEFGSIPYAEVVRMAACFGQTPSADLSPVMRACRAVKTERQQQMQRESGQKQSLVYERIPRLYREGMTDLELQIEIERASRLEGCLGAFRVGGQDMELFMGNVITGDNADTPSPFDFSMGGAGIDPSVPVGADGTVIRPGKPVMVDVNGNYTGYMTDQTRMYIAGDTPAEAERVNRVSIDICAALAAMMEPGVKASALYEKALEMATEAGLADYFMGHRSHAGFVGHGQGIEVSEAPILAPRSRDILEAGNVIALEPKFVIPGLGAIGIENTYIVHEHAPAERITTAPEEIMRLD